MLLAGAVDSKQPLQEAGWKTSHVVIEPFDIDRIDVENVERYVDRLHTNVGELLLCSTGFIALIIVGIARDHDALELVRRTDREADAKTVVERLGFAGWNFESFACPVAVTAAGGAGAARCGCRFVAQAGG